MRVSLLPVVFVLLAGMAGCDQLGIESTSQVAARRDAEGKAVGGGCRHAARSLEQCYEQNKRADKAAVFAGWREMNDYMRENNIQAQPPEPEPPAAVEVAAAEDAGSPDGGAAGEVKSDAGSRAKSESKSESKSDAKNDARSDLKAEVKGKGDKPARPQKD